MKKITNRKKYIILAMLIFILLILLVIIPEKVEAAGNYDYIIIGDSLTSQMYATFTGSWNQFVQQSKNINGKEVMFLGAGGYGHDYWFEQNYQDVRNALKKAKKGATCIIYLGGNDPDNYGKYPKSLNKMATEFTNVNFYFCSYPHSNNANGDRGSYNKTLDKFNNEVFNGMKKLSRYNKNLFYKEINNIKITIDNKTKTLDHFIMDDTKYVQDSDHFALPLYKAVWNQIMCKLTKGSSSSSASSRETSSGSSGKTSSGGASLHLSIKDNNEERESHDFTDVLGSTDYYSSVGDIDSSDANKVETATGKILSIVTNIGIIVSLLMLVILGIGYMLGNQVEVKKQLKPYLIGAFLLFSLSTVIKIIHALGSSIN